MAGIMEDVNVQFFSSAMSEDSPGPLYVDDPLPNSPYRSPIRHNPPAMQFAMVDSDDSPSPQSSLHDSSSDSSGRHKRHNSSNSSRSILLGRDATMAEWKPDDLLLADDRKNAPLLDDTNVAFSDQAMENDFDFESAASSPSGCVDSKKFVKNRPRDDVHMPYRPFGAPGVASHHHFKPVRYRFIVFHGYGRAFNLVHFVLILSVLAEHSRNPPSVSHNREPKYLTSNPTTCAWITFRSE